MADSREPNVRLANQMKFSLSCVLTKHRQSVSRLGQQGRAAKMTNIAHICLSSCLIIIIVILGGLFGLAVASADPLDLARSQHRQTIATNLSLTTFRGQLYNASSKLDIKQASGLENSLPLASSPALVVSSSPFWLARFWPAQLFKLAGNGDKYDHDERQADDTIYGQSDLSGKWIASES